MLLNRSSSGSRLCPPPSTGTGSLRQTTRRRKETVRAGQVPHDQRFQTLFSNVRGWHIFDYNSFPESCNKRRENAGTLFPK